MRRSPRGLRTNLDELSPVKRAITLVVIVVIVFFVLGYAVGRLFL